MDASGHPGVPAFGRSGLGPRGGVEIAAEDAVLASARARAEELGCVPPAPECGAALRVLVGLLAAKSVVEVGTGTGVSGLWMLRGMREDGVLTSIDPEVEYQRAARVTFREGGFPASRVRLINGRPLAVLPRLTDGYYDAVIVVDAPWAEYPDYLTEALRLLRPGGLVAFTQVLFGGRVHDPGARDPDTVVLRDLIRTIRDHPDLLPTILPIDDGLLVAVKCR